MCIGVCKGRRKYCCSRYTTWRLQKKQSDKYMLAGGTAFACQADVSKPDTVALLVDTTIKTYGKIDALINNAAIQVNKTIEDTTF